MRRFLFSAQPASGHLNPLLTIATQLRSKGHTVFFAVSGGWDITDKINKMGFEVKYLNPPLPTLGLLFLKYTSGYIETSIAMKLFFAGLLSLGKALIKVIEEEKPDCIVTDFGFHASCLAAEVKGIPHVVIYHAGLCFKGKGIPPFGSGLPIEGHWGIEGKILRFCSKLLERSLCRDISGARRHLGLPQSSAKGLNMILSPWLTLALTMDSIEAPRDPFPPSTFFIGPCFGNRKAGNQGDFPFEKLDPEKPKIYVSLGTVFNNKPSVFRKIAAGFADGKYQLIISAGGAYQALKKEKFPDNILLFERVPQVDLLPLVDAVINHGGNNTVNETLAAGKPLLVLPVGGEQGDNASRVVYLGSGIRADIWNFSPREIREKIDRLFTDEKFKKSAAKIAHTIDQSRGTEVAAELIEWVTNNKKPLPRPNGYPLTITKETPLPWET